MTVWNEGRVSQTAADVLTARGFDAWSLSGGMKAWSLAWNAADVPLPDTSVRVIQVRRTGKGCLSRPEWAIRYVVETHVHADHLSRARELARQTGATLGLPKQNRVGFEFTAADDGDRIRFGSACLTATHTPGHTDESSATS